MVTFLGSESAEWYIAVGKALTVLTITTYPTAVYEDTEFIVNGNLKDSAGNPIPNKEIAVYWINDAVPANSGGPLYAFTDVMGAWQVTPRISEPGTYHILAQFIEDVAYGGSDDESPTFEVLSLEITTSLTLQADAVALRVNETFRVWGKLWRNDTDEGLPGYPIEIVHNGTPLGSTVTDANGDYVLTDRSFGAAGLYTIKAMFAGSVELGASEAELAIVVDGSPLLGVVASAIALGVATGLIYLGTKK